MSGEAAAHSGQEVMKIISADERLRERRGAKVLILGPAGVGKTSLLRTLDPAQTLIQRCRSRRSGVLDLQVDTIRVNDWATARDLACRIGGTEQKLPANSGLFASTFRSRSAATSKISSATEYFRR